MNRTEKKHVHNGLKKRIISKETSTMEIFYLKKTKQKKKQKQRFIITCAHILN